MVLSANETDGDGKHQSTKNAFRRLARQRQREAKTHHNIVTKHILNNFTSGALGKPLATRTRSNKSGPQIKPPQCIYFNGTKLLFLNHGLEIAHDFGPHGGVYLGWGLKTLQDIQPGAPITQYQVCGSH